MDISSVSAHSLEWYEDAGKLSGMVIDENKIEPENRIPRITSATWCVNRSWICSPLSPITICSRILIGNTRMEPLARSLTASLSRIMTTAANSRSSQMDTR